MAGYGIQNAVSGVIDNSVKIKKLVDLLPTEEDQALEQANRKAEATGLRSELANQDAAKAQSDADKAQDFSDSLKKRSANRKRDITRKVNKGSLDPDAGEFLKQDEERRTGNARLNAEGKARDARTYAQKAQQLADQALEDKRAAIEAKIKVLESAGTRKKSVFERLRGGSK